ncbi:MAG: GNAT family N-acetyltransferase [Muribaculaceae bacterium]|nr:GNAT family N-acetyltransferase [Muribaculaceae bacterium]
MEIRLSTAADIDRIMDVYESAKKFMRSHGNMNQWTGGYPSREVILTDIAHGSHYIGLDDDGDILMVFSFILGEDPTYKVIEGGSWLNDKPYGTIHRIASTGFRGGMLKECVRYCSVFADNIRVDTHADNSDMQRAIKHAGFHYCGIIYLADGSPRIAFQKEIRRAIEF